MRDDAAATGVLAAAVLVAASPALAAYAVPGGAALVVIAAAVPAAWSLVAARPLGLPAATANAVSAAGLVVLLLAGAGSHPGAVWPALVHGPGRLLVETLPLHGAGAESPLVAAAWLASAAAAELALRGRSWRRASLAPPALLFVACYAVATAAPHRSRAAGPLLLLLLAAVACVLGRRAEPDGAAAWWRGPVTGTALAAVVAAALAAGSLAVPRLSAPPAVVHRRPPLAAPAVTDPLAVMAALRDGDLRSAPTTLLSVEVAEPWTGYLAAAYLDIYDGATWRFDATFQPTGGRVPGRPAGLVSPVSQTVEIESPLPVPFLPALDRPVEVSGPAVAADPSTGMLISSDKVGLFRYTVVSASPPVTFGRLPSADGVDQTIAGPSDSSLPPSSAADVAATARFAAGLTGLRPAPTVAFLQALTAALQAREERVDPTLAAPTRPAPTRPAPTRPALTHPLPAHPVPAHPGPSRPAAGHPAPTTTTTLAPPATTGGTSVAAVINAVTVNRAATPEQFATFVALVARYLGVPARVVTGWRVAAGSSAQLLPAGTYPATNRQAWAWVEIPVSGMGWVVCDPTPDARVTAASPPSERASAPTPTTVPPAANALPRPGPGGHALAPPGRVHSSPSRGSSPGLVAGVAAAAALAVLALAGPGQAAARRWWRRRRRRRSDPRQLAVGAWLELIDAASRAGMAAAPGATGAELAGEVGRHFGPELGPLASEVAATADQALFAPAAPPGPEEAGTAWESARQLRRRMLATLDARQKLWAALRVGATPARPSPG